MMQARIKYDSERVRGPDVTRSLHQLSDPVDRVATYRIKDYKEEAERQRRVRWKLIEDKGPAVGMRPQDLPKKKSPQPAPKVQSK